MSLSTNFPPIEIIPNLADQVTTQEVAVRLGYHVKHVHQMLHEGDVKVGNMWFVYEPSVKEYIKNNACFEKFGPRRGNE